MKSPSHRDSNPITDLIQAVRLILKNRESNSQHYLMDTDKLVLKNRESNLNNDILYIYKLLSLFNKIIRAESTALVFLYLCLKRGAATALILQKDLSLTEPTIYRAIKQLRTLDIVHPAIKIKIQKTKGGPRATIWAFSDASNDDIVQAMNLHKRMLSPKYRVAEEVAQDILDSYLTQRKVEEITYREIIVIVKEMRIPFATPDIADMAAQYLRERGVKVWR